VGGNSRPRLVALSTKILLFTNLNGTGLIVRAIDPADPATGFASAATTVLASASFGSYYDVVRVASTDTAVGVARRAVTTSYEAFKVTAALAVTNATKARVCDGAIAVSANATHAQVIRTDFIGAGPAVDIKGDLLLVTDLSDVYTAQAIGDSNAGVTQIAAAHRSVTDSGVYRCYVFWSDGENDRPQLAGSEVKYNWVSTGNTLGTQASFIKSLGVASRAFDHEGRIYVNLVFAGASDFVGSGVQGHDIALQNTYFLYRDDAFLVAKSAHARAGGFVVTASHLPGVDALGSGVFAWCATERRVVPAGGVQKAYADRGPRDVMITFDSNDARRCARLGSTLYVACGEGVLQYDGEKLTELGFHHYPYFFETSAGAGSLEDGKYFVKSTYRSDNATGEKDRSTTATVAEATISGGPGGLTFSLASPLVVTHKTNVAVEFWRTLKNPTEDSPFRLVSGLDPTDTTGANCFVFNTPTSGVLADFLDSLSDTDMRGNANNPENGAVLENLTPPPAKFIAASDTRLFLAGIAGDPDRVWYSKQRNEGEVVAFHDGLTVAIPPEGGDITGIVWANETLIVFREAAIYVLLNDGSDNTGGGQNYVARKVPDAIGAVNQESIADTHIGVVFKSRKGWHVLDRAFKPHYIGGPITDYDSETVLAVHAIETKHQVRVLTGSRMLVLDTHVTELSGRPTWGEWEIASAVHAAMLDGTYAYTDGSSVKTEVATFAVSGDAYGIDIELVIKLNDLQGFGRIRAIQPIGEYRSPCTVRMRLKRNYKQAYFQDKSKVFPANSESVGDPLQLKLGPSIQQVESITVRITITPDVSSGSGESVRLTGLGLEVGFKPGLFKGLPAALRQ